MLCIFVLGMHAKLQKENNLEQVFFDEIHPGNWSDRHKTPSKKRLQVYYDGEFVYLQNALGGERISLLDEFGEVLYEEIVSASECVIKKPQSAKAIQINNANIVLIGYFNQ